MTNLDPSRFQIYRRRLRRGIAALSSKPQSNLRVFCEHLPLPKSPLVEFKARIIAMTFAVNSVLDHRYKTYSATMAKVHETHDTQVTFFP